MKNEPKVSIIIPVYNGSKYIKEAIDSAINQTYKNIEIIVVNDGSNDEGKTKKICKSYGNKIKYIEKDNGGVSTALNLGIKNMTGEYFSWLSHDDRYYPEKVEKQIKLLNKLNNEKIILYSNYDAMDINSVIFYKYIFNHEELIKKPEYALLHGKINGLSLLIPKEAFTKIGVFDEKLRCVQDYDLWLKFMKEYTYIHMEDILVTTRMHQSQTTNTNPLVISEGNEFWLKAIEYPTKKRKIELEGSEYNYYKKFLEFIITTPYNEAIEHVKNKMKVLNKNAQNDIDIIIEKNNKQQELLNKKISYFKRAYRLIKRHGVLYFMKKLYNKLTGKNKG